jgi:NAD(P)-dependent dehydrogenase (short-subunit alcohol dehydrogenase family)
MTLTDLKGTLLARKANLATELLQKRQTVTLIEADLLRARREADTVSGALQATERDLGDVDAAVHAAGKPVAPAVPAPLTPGSKAAP